MYGHNGNVRCVKFAAGSKKIVSGAEDRKVMVWEWESSSSPVRVLQREYPITGIGVHKNVFFTTGCALEVWDISKREESRKMYTERWGDLICHDVCGKNGKVALGVMKSGEKLVVWDSDANAVIFKDNVDFTCWAFSPNGQYLANGVYCTIDLFDVSTKPIRVRRLKSYNGAGNMTSVAFSRDGKKIVSGWGDGTIRVLDVECGQCDGIVGRILSRVTSVSFTSDGKRIISGSTDGIIRIWDACLEKESKEREKEHMFFFSSHSQPISAYRNVCYGPYIGPVTDVSISRNMLRVATASDDGTVRLWDTQTGEQTGMPLRCPSALGAISVALSPDGRKVVSGFCGALQQWSTRTRTQIGETFYGYCGARCVVFSRDGYRIISGSFHCNIRIWNAEKNKTIGYIAPLGSRNGIFLHPSLISCVAESDDCSHIVSRDTSGRTIIQSRELEGIVWDSEASERESDSSIQDDEAEKIVRSCGPYVPRLWPKSFSQYTDELYCEEGRVHSNLLDRKTMIADAPGPWEYNSERKLFVFALASGAAAMCKLIVE